MSLITEHLRFVEKLWLMDLKKSEDNMTALHLAALNNHTQMLEQLLEFVADRVDVNSKCWNNRTPLQLAVARLSFEACEILFRMSAAAHHHRPIDVNHQDNDGHTALHDLMLAYSIANIWHYASASNNNLVKYNKKPGVELTEERLDPKRTLDIEPYARIGKLLIDKGASVEIRNKKLLTAFELCNEASLVRALEEHAKKHSKNK